MTIEQDAIEALEAEASYDARWIGENLYLFDPLAREGFAALGRGTIVANVGELIRRIHYEEGHPFNYRTAERGDWLESVELYDPSQRVSVSDLLKTYAPQNEMVVVLAKDFRVSAYRVPLLAEEDRDQEIRGAYVNAEAEERRNRLASSDPWGRGFRLAKPYALLWDMKRDLS